MSYLALSSRSSQSSRGDSKKKMVIKPLKITIIYKGIKQWSGIRTIGQIFQLVL